MFSFVASRLLSRDAANCRLGGELRLATLPDRVDRVTGSLNERTRELLVEERYAEVLRIDLGIAAPPRELHRRADGLLRLQCELLEVHGPFRSGRVSSGLR